MSVSRVNLTLIDSMGKSASVGAWVTQLTAINFTAEMALIDDLRDAISAVSLLALTKDQRLAEEEKFAPALPVDPNAVKGVRWLVRGVDSNGNSVTFQIPGADLSLKDSGGFMDITAGVGLDLKNAIEAVVKSNDGETVTVQSVVYLDK